MINKLFSRYNVQYIWFALNYKSNKKESGIFYIFDRNQEYKVLCKTTHFYISRLKSLMSFPFKKLEAQPTESVLLT